MFNLWSDNDAINNKEFTQLFLHITYMQGCTQKYLDSFFRFTPVFSWNLMVDLCVHLYLSSSMLLIYRTMDNSLHSQSSKESLKNGTKINTLILRLRY